MGKERNYETWEMIIDFFEDIVHPDKIRYDICPDCGGLLYSPNPYTQHLKACKDCEYMGPSVLIIEFDRSSLEKHEEKRARIQQERVAERLDRYLRTGV